MNWRTAPGFATGRARSRGFALIIVVALLALLVLALVSLATLTRVETQVGVNSRKLAQARQNARFSLEQAIAELQRHAGPDTRITATAEIAGVINANKHWTGVWDSSSGDMLTWLVSGNQNGSLDYDPESVPVSIPGSATALSTDVKVKGDEARLLVGPKSVGSNSPLFVAAPLVDLEGSVAGESRDKIIGRYAWWVADEGVKAFVSDWDGADELTYFPYSDAASRDRVRHMALPRVRGEIAAEWGDGWANGDSEELKKVLQPMQTIYVDVANPSASTRRSRMREHFHDVTVSSRAILANTRDGGLKWDLNGDVPDGDSSPALNRHLRFLRLQPSIVGENEFYSEIGSPDTEEVSIRPVLAGAWVNMSAIIPSAGTTGEAGTVTGTITARIWNPYSVALQTVAHRVRLDGLHPVPIQTTVGPSWNSMIQFSSSSAIEIDIPSRTMQPGEVLEIADTFSPSFEDAFPSIDSTTRFSIGEMLSAATLEFRTSTGEVISTCDVGLTASAQTGREPGSETTIAAGLRLDDSQPAWLRLNDPRSSAPDSSAWATIASIGGSMPVVSGNVVGASGLPPVVAFDLPRSVDSSDEASAISLGVLCGLQFTGSGAFSIGGPSGGAANAIFDACFLSTLPTSDLNAWAPAAGHPLPNTRLELLRTDRTGITDLSRGQRASAFLVRGAFNVNSTSVSAWKGILAGERLADDQYAIFRLSRSVPDTIDTSAAVWSRTFHKLAASNLDAIATQLVSLLQSRGRPFNSIEAFLNAGVLQSAIDSSGINQTGNPELTQADFVSTLAPILTARSDTFTIRAYGETVNPLIDNPDDPNYVQARAWCEAVVQRVPTKVDPDEPVETNATGFGRRFVVTSFRWLSPDDI